MARWTSLKETFVIAVRNWRLWLVQFFANAAIFLVFLGWLRFPDAHWWQLLLQILVVILIAVALLVLHGGTLNYLADAHQDRLARLLPAFSKALKHLAAIAILAFIFHFLEHLAGHLEAYQQTFPGFLRSEFPAWLRRLISEPALDSTYIFLVAVLVWVVLPGLLLPFALFASGRGFRGLIAFRDWRRAIASLAYWIVLAVSAVLGVYCTGKVMGWKLDPKTSTIGREATSLVFRLLFAYLLGIFAWLLTGSVLGRNVTRSSGQSTAQPQ